MNFWIDAQSPPSLAIWLTETFGVSATSLRDLELRDAQDTEIFSAARTAGIVVVSKDAAGCKMCLISSGNEHYEVWQG